MFLTMHVVFDSIIARLAGNFSENAVGNGKKGHKESSKENDESRMTSPAL